MARINKSSGSIEGSDSLGNGSSLFSTHGSNNEKSMKGDDVNRVSLDTFSPYQSIEDADKESSSINANYPLTLDLKSSVTSEKVSSIIQPEALPEEASPLVPIDTNKEFSTLGQNTRLTKGQVDQLRNYVLKNREIWKKEIIAKHIRAEVAKLPRSLLIVPDGKGDVKVYILLKRKRGDENLTPEEKRNLELGRGSYKTATLALDIDSFEKKVFLSEIEGQRLDTNEIDYMQQFSNKEGFVGGSTVSYRFKHVNIPKTGMLVDYYDQGDLESFLDRIEPSHINNKPRKRVLSDEEQIQIALDIATHLAEMHTMGIVHCDVKPANILLKTDELKPDKLKVGIADFGLTTAKDQMKRTRGNLVVRKGTPLYLDPEHSLDPYRAIHSYHSDVWSYGATLYDMKIGIQFEAGSSLGYHKDGRNQYKLWPGANQSVKNPKLFLEEWKQTNLPNRLVPHTLDYVIDKCLNIDSTKRWKMETIRDHLNAMVALKSPHQNL